MIQIARLLAANEGYAAARANVADSRPGRRLAVVTCMDARIDVFAVLGLHLGEAHVIRNAGGRVTDDVLRSLALSSHVLGVDTVVVMQHTKCGLVGVDDEELRRVIGVDFEFLAIDDHAAALQEDIDILTTKSYLAPAPGDRRVHLRRGEWRDRRRGALGAPVLRVRELRGWARRRRRQRCRRRAIVASTWTRRASTTRLARVRVSGDTGQASPLR